MNNYYDYSDNESENSQNSVKELYNDDSFIINNSIINNISFIRQRIRQRRQEESLFINLSAVILNEINETDILNIDFDNFIEDLILEDVKVTLSNEQMNNLQKIKLEKNNIMNYTKDCLVCLESLNLNDDLLLLKCNHYFHYTCIHPWLTKESTKCPTCRHPST